MMRIPGGYNRPLTIYYYCQQKYMKAYPSFFTAATLKKDGRNPVNQAPGYSL